MTSSADKSEEAEACCKPTDEIECSVCLHTAVHPVKLPCGHIFCFLCAKGVANRSKRCALCRQEVPIQVLLKPNLVKEVELDKTVAFDDGFQWYYEGSRGWWQYDERTSKELETYFKSDKKTFELLIAGFLYVIDLDSMVQYRRNDPTRRRRIKRDSVNIPKKGIAGLRVQRTETQPARNEGDGNENEGAAGSNTNQRVTVKADNNNLTLDTDVTGAAASVEDVNKNTEDQGEEDDEIATDFAQLSL